MSEIVETTTPLFEVRGLSVSFRQRAKASFGRSRGIQTKALDDVSFAVPRGGALGIVGESGSGKTTLARIVVGLVEAEAGEVLLDGEDVRRMDQRRLRRRVQLVYQDPYSSLNPVFRVGDAIAEPALVHGLVSREGARARALELAEQVGLTEAILDRYPRQLSGGQRQRVAIARALSVEPELLIADEAVSALDVSVQAQILRLLERLRQELGLTLVFIAHQLGTVAQLCDTVAIMCRGELVEFGPTASIFESPEHPYTQELLAAQPDIDHWRQRSGPTDARNDRIDASS